MTSLRRRCPFCLERTGSTGSRENISIRLDTLKWKCFRCGAYGDLTPWSAQKLGVSDVPTVQTSRKETKPETSLPDYYTPLYPRRKVRRVRALRRHLEYLDRRGVSSKAIRRFKLGVCSGKDIPKSLRGAIILPLLDKNIGWLYRLREGGYRNSNGLSRETAIYNGSVLGKGKSIYVVEGPFDAVCLHPLKAVATLGKDITSNQIQRLVEHDGPLVFAYDGDAWKTCLATAYRAAIRGAKQVYWVKLPPGKDPADMGVSGVMSLRHRRIGD